MRAIAPIVLGACVALVAACGSEDAKDSGAKAVSPSATSPAPSPPADKDKLVKPTGDAVKARPVKWEKAIPERGGMALRITWWSGVEPCHVLDRVKVEPGAKGVTVTLYEGMAPGKKNLVCTEQAIKKTTVVKLKRRVGKRAITDGAGR